MIGDYPRGVYAHAVRWGWGAKVRAAETGDVAPSNLLPTDQFQVLAAMLGTSAGVAGIRVDEQSAMGVSAFYRALSLISGQLGQLAMPTYSQEAPTAVRRQVSSIFDNPDGDDGQTPFEWKETLYLHLLMHGKAGAIKVRNEAGGLIRLALVHPLAFRERAATQREIEDGKRPRGGLYFDLTLDTGKAVTYDSDSFWYVPGLSLDGRTGISLLEYARNSMGTTIAGDQAAGRMFSNGALISGLATPEDDEDLTSDVPEIKRQINNAVNGWENAGTVAVIARRLKFTPWQMSAADAQFISSRQFQIEEIARWTGVPPHLLMQTEKQTSWGTGVEMQDRALGRTVLGTWATRVEERAGRLLPRPRFVEVDFSRLERPSPDREVEIDLQQVAAGVMTVAEYRQKRGWPPLEEQPETAPKTGSDDDDPPAE